MYDLVTQTPDLLYGRNKEYFVIIDVVNRATAVKINAALSDYGYGNDDSYFIYVPYMERMARIPMNEIKVSVIVAVYNVDRYLRQCLDSIIGQTMREIEIICVNDCSTDNSTQILQEYARKDCRIRIITMRNNSGNAAEPRNAGLRVSAGEYVSILDGDDFFEQNMLEEMYARAVLMNADVVLSNRKFYYSETNRIEKHVYYEKKPNVKNFLENNKSFCVRDCPDIIFEIAPGFVYTVLIKRSVIIANKLTFAKITRHNACDDVVFCYSLLSVAQNITYLDKEFVFYRKDSLNSQVNTKRNYSPIAVVDVICKLYCDLDLLGTLQICERSLLNCLTRSFIYTVSKSTDYSICNLALREFKQKVIVDMNLDTKEKDFFIDDYVCTFVHELSKYSVEDYLCLQMNKTQQEQDMITKLSEIYSKNVVLYGGGVVGRQWFSKFVKNDAVDVVLWVDTYKRNRFIASPEEILSLNCDYFVLVAIKEKKTFDEILRNLRGLGVKKDTVLWSREVASILQCPWI